jgi:AraC family transcriptional regulator of adaptative response/methylated-DNA-[protein]-cysteine methyltransferase
MSSAAHREITDSAVADPRWQAVLDRNADADGEFYYSVSTTGIYCRPSCGSRRANPKNVAFHATAGDAERAGFRPCKRCKPNQASLAERNAALITDACRLLETADSPPTLEELAARFNTSRYHFHRLFKSITGLTPRQYASANRERRVRERLAAAASVTDAIYDAGYNSNSRFYENADHVLGMTPTEFRAGGSNAAIRFAVGECSLGSILVACSDRGVCAILIGDDPDALARELQDQFPQAVLHGGDEKFEALVARVIGFVDAPSIGLDLPLDVRGTAFQRRVWEALRGIPCGETASYSDIAAKIGAPKAARAVAQACAANVLAVAIPCHRVVRSDGALSGYRWGVERKRVLLEQESGR